MDIPSHQKVIVIGSGPAGYTSAIYLSRANLKPLVIEGYMSGGQLMWTTEVENFPGFPEGVMGPDLMQNMRKQAEKFGATFLTVDATKVDLQANPKVIETPKGTFTADSVVLSTGATARMLGLESEKRLLGHGVATCATCDGAFYKEKEIAVVGGGDSALEEATFLTRFASKVYVLHRRDTLKASDAMQDRARANPKIEFIWNVEVAEFVGEKKLEKVILRDTQTGEMRDLAIAGCFIAIGHIPNTTMFQGQLELDSLGYLHTEGKSSKTTIPGVFACGDVQDHVYRQAITAAGSGCVAALDAERYLDHHG
ncbi:thioredoxin-disulfide reductase [Candidatus Gracilibacteria bacterium CG17_big_fil_post_rev_8_21_14_2_50_48_13]|nr:MAG: thioredoxin-disulfide reductase [Candidatus Gracilibacteria bacterium CG17_big_fil_post_rev_8_21_14_2_50_48_13]